MINFNKRVLFFSLQYYLTFDELLDVCELTVDEAMDLCIPLNEKTSSKPFTLYYGRTFCHFQYKYMKKSIIKNKYYIKDILLFLLESAENEQEVTLADIREVFNIDEYKLINLLVFLLEDNIYTTPIIMGHNKLVEEIRISIEKSFQENLDNKIKLFKGNKANTEELLAKSETMPIEELAFYFNTSCYVIERELLWNCKGGVFFNPNIQYNYPYFISKNRHKFFTVELLYIIDHIDDKIEYLAEKIKTSVNNLQQVITILDKFKMPRELIKKILVDDELFGEGGNGSKSITSLYIKELRGIVKDNGAYLYRFSFEELFNKAELDKFDSLVTSAENKLKEICDLVDSLEDTWSIVYFKDLNRKKEIGKYLYENDSVYCIEVHGETKVLLQSEISIKDEFKMDSKLLSMESNDLFSETENIRSNQQGYLATPEETTKILKEAQSFD